MKINITSRHFKASDSLKNYLTSKIEDLAKYSGDIIYADAVLSQLNDSTGIEDKSCEINLKVKDKLFMAKENSAEYELAIDKAITKLDSQLHKYKDKLTSKRNIKSQSSYKTI